MLYKNIICLFCASLCEWMSGVVSCTTYSSMRAGAAHSVNTAPAVSLSEDMDTNTESLTDTERTINNPFIILFEKTTVKYTDTQSSSLLPVKIKVRLLTRRNWQKLRLYYNVAYFWNNNLSKHLMDIIFPSFLFSKSLLCSPLRKHKRIKVIFIWLHFKTLIKLLKLYALVSLPPFLIVYLYYIKSTESRKTKSNQNLWIVMNY